MKIHKLTIELDHSEAESLRDFINGYFRMQEELGRGSGGSHITLARQLLQILPQNLPPKRPDMFDVPEKECKGAYKDDLVDSHPYGTSIHEIIKEEDQRVMEALNKAAKKPKKKK